MPNSSPATLDTYIISSVRNMTETLDHRKSQEVNDESMFSSYDEDMMVTFNYPWIVLPRFEGPRNAFPRLDTFFFPIRNPGLDQGRWRVWISPVMREWVRHHATRSYWKEWQFVILYSTSHSCCHHLHTLFDGFSIHNCQDTLISSFPQHPCHFKSVLFIPQIYIVF